VRRLLAGAALLCLTGCAPDLAALAADPTAVCIRATYVYGSVEINRNHGCEAKP
jgi:hypothetical protein